MRQLLKLPPGLEGDVWRHRHPGRANATHHHAELEFNLITRGSGRYLLASRQYDLHRGDLLWLFPRQEHVLIEQTADFEMWIGVFKPKAVNRLAVDPNAKVLRQLNPPGDFCRRLSQSDCLGLEALLKEVAGARQWPGLFNAGLGYSLLRAWRQFEGAADIPVRDVHPAIETAVRLIREQTTGSGLRDLARQSGLSASRLSRLFKQQTGVALAEFRNRQRVGRFLRLYGTGQRVTMICAALEAGFGSYPQFYRVFKRVTGEPPLSYRRKLR